MSKRLRVVIGCIFGPLALALLMSLPAVITKSFGPFLLLNLVFCGVLFGVCGGISHLILRKMRWRRLRQYVGVMFAVATLVLAGAQFVMYATLFGEGGSEFHLGTQVMTEGRFTLGGVALLLGQAVFGAACLAGCYAIFWRIAMQPGNEVV
jgi:hypothetical protein